MLLIQIFPILDPSMIRKMEAARNVQERISIYFGQRVGKCIRATVCITGLLEDLTVEAN